MEERDGGTEEGIACFGVIGRGRGGDTGNVVDVEGGDLMGEEGAVS